MNFILNLNAFSWKMITPSVQALAELTARIKMLELEINTLAAAPRVPARGSSSCFR